MNELFINTYKKRPIIVARAEGSFLYGVDGKKYLDFLSGISTNNLGYSNPGILKAVSNQLQKVIHPSNYYYTQAQIELAEKLVSTSGLNKVFFANSGTEVNEASIVFLSKYSSKQTSDSKNEIIVFDGTFLGRTHGSRIAANGGNVDNVVFKTCKFNDIEDFIKNVSDKTLAVHLELVLGHGGIKGFSVECIKTICSICNSKDILIFIDEVQTGLGRTGDIYAFMQFGIKPDLVTIGKSLGGGIPLSAVLVSDRVSNCITPGDYGCTMGGNSLACASGLVIIDYLLDINNIQQIKNKSIYLEGKLKELQKDHPSIMDVRCYGLMCGLEIKVQDVSDVVTSAIESGLLIDVVNKNTLRLTPPLTVSYNEIDIATSILNESLR